MNPWLTILEKLNLSKSEQEIVKRFKADPDGRTFLPISDILRNYNLFDESLEILVSGVQRHPKFTVARVVLAREYFNKGLILDSWNALDESETSLTENVLAQKLKFRLAILLGYESALRAIIRHLQSRNFIDEQINRLINEFEVSGIEYARKSLLQSLERQNIKILLPRETLEQEKLIEENFSDIVLSEQHDSTIPNWVGGYQVLKLDEIFFGENSSELGQEVRSEGLELDSVTLAEIYEQQNHFNKALSMYRRLLRLNPNNNNLKRKIAELAVKTNEQKREDLTVDPGIVDTMEQVEIIDTQLRFLNSLLEKLS